MKTRQPIKRETVVEVANAILLNTPDELKELRQGVCNTTEAVLMRSNSYKGYGYLSEEDMRKSDHGHSVGINLWPEGTHTDRFMYTHQFANIEDALDARFGGTDKTRVFYY